MVGINALGTDPLLLFSVVRLELNQVTLRRFLELNRVNRCRDSYRTANHGRQGPLRGEAIHFQQLLSDSKLKVIVLSTTQEQGEIRHANS